MLKTRVSAQSCATLVLCLIGSVASAAIYKTTDADGKTVYSDTPSSDQGAVQVEMDSTPLSIISAPKAPQPQSPSAPQSSASADTNYQVTITSPVEGSTVFKAQQTLQIQASLDQPLGIGASVQVLLDGEVVGQGVSAQVDLMPMPRGEHSVEVQVLSSEGKVLGSSSSGFYLYQPSRLF